MGYMPGYLRWRHKMSPYISRLRNYSGAHGRRIALKGKMMPKQLFVQLYAGKCQNLVRKLG